MASEIRVDKITSLSGVGTITPSPTGIDIAGITTVATLKATTGIVTTLTATTGIVTSLEATTGDITTLRAPTGIVTSLEATTGDITTLRAPTGIVTTFVTNTAKIGAAVTITESGIEASGIGITCANINGTQIGGRRNIIINGAMQVAQRGTSFAAPADGYTLDRWSVYENLGTGQVEVTQEAVTDLIGFTKAAKINTTTAESGVPSASGTQYATYINSIEAQDLQHIGNGTSAAKPLIFSFYVKSNVTGTFCVSFYKQDNTTRLLSLPYTINSANTWERKILSIPADTSGGGINNDNGLGLGIYFILARKSGYSGTVSTSWINYTDSGWANTCTATIFENVNDHIMFTGCQLEVGSQATDFEHRTFGDELALCQRYFQVLKAGMGVGSGSNMSIIVPLFCPMRATPSLGKTSGDFNFGDMVSQGFQSSSSPTIDGGYLNQDLEVTGYIGGFSGPTNYRPYRHEPTASDGALITANAEL